VDPCKTGGDPAGLLAACHRGDVARDVLRIRNATKISARDEIKRHFLPPIRHFLGGRQLWWWARGSCFVEQPRIQHVHKLPNFCNIVNKFTDEFVLAYSILYPCPPSNYHDRQPSSSRECTQVFWATEHVDILERNTKLAVGYIIHLYEGEIQGPTKPINAPHALRVQ
jgi:hypothetical protein